MDNLERNILGMAVAIAYAIIWVAAAVVVFRFGVRVCGVRVRTSD